MTSRTGQTMRTWASCKPQKTSLARTHWSATIPSRKIAAHEGAFMSLFTRQSGGQRVLPSQNSEDTHQQSVSNLVVLAHVQLKSFYRLSTLDVTHVRKCTRPLPLNRTASDGKLGAGLGTRLIFSYTCYLTIISRCLCKHDI